jgi:hypothetical protein
MGLFCTPTFPVSDDPKEQTRDLVRAAAANLRLFLEEGTVVQNNYLLHMAKSELEEALLHNNDVKGLSKEEAEWLLRRAKVV